MNQLISQLRNIQLRQILTAFLVGLTFITSIVVGQIGFSLQAQAAPTTPETRSYQPNLRDTQAPSASQPKVKAEESSEGLFETVKEKLNLDEPLPDSTKAFFKQVQGEDIKVEEPRPSGKGETPKNE